MLIAISMFASGPAEAAYWHWNNGGADSNWSTGANWEGGTAPNTDWDHIYFGATTVELHGTTSDIDVPFSVASFLVNDYAYGQDHPSNVGFSGTINVQSPLTVGGNYFFIRPDTQGTPGTPAFNNTSTIIFDSMGTVIIDEVGINLGDVVIRSFVQLNTDVTMTSLTLNNGSTLRLNGQTLTVDSLTLNGGTLRVEDGTLNVDGPYTQSGGTFTSDNADGTAEFSSSVTLSGGTFNNSSGTVIFDGTSTMVISDNSTRNLGAVVVRGPVELGSNVTMRSVTVKTDSIDLAGRTLSISGGSGAQLRLGVDNPFGATPDGTVQIGGELGILRDAATNRGITFDNLRVVSGTTTFQASIDTVDINGVFFPSVGSNTVFVPNSGGKLVTFDGSISDVSAGTVTFESGSGTGQIDANGTLPSAGLEVVVVNGTWSLTTANLVVESSTTVNTGGSLTLAAGADLDSRGTVSVNDGVINTNGGTLSSTGVVQLTSSGGTITISGANQLNATGGVDIDGGTLEFSAGASGVVSGGAGFALGGGTVNLNDGTLDVDSTFNQTAGTFNAGSGVFRLSADFDFDGGLFNADTSNTTFDSDATTTVSSAFGGFNDVNITGGTVNVSAGAVLIQDDLNLSTETQLNIGAGLFRVAGDTTINGSAGIEITTSGVDTRWNNVTIPATGTFEASDINATITFDGTSSFTVGDGDGQAATVTLTGAAGAGLSLRSSSNTWQLIDHVDDTNTLSIFNVIAFDADSSAGKSIFAGSGSLLVRTTNWHTVLDHFSIETISTPQTAGVPFDVQLVAEDIYDNTVTTFTGTVTINDTTGSLTPAISGAFLGGLRTQSVAVTVADTNTTADVTITVQDSGTDATGISNAFDMQAGSLDHFGVSTVPSTIVAGENFSVTITAQDADNNTVTGFNGTAVLSDETGTLTPTVTGSFGAGVVTQNDLAITLADSNTTADVRVTATRSGGTETGQSNLFDVQPNDLHHFAVGTITSPRIANESFDLELTAQDIHDNTVTDFTGTVTISDTTGTVTPTTSAAFTGGVLTQSVEVTEADPDTTADVKITVQDSGTGATGISNAFDVQAGSLDHFSLSIVPSTIVAGESFSVTITAEDADNNTVTGFTGTAVLTDDTGTLTPTVTDSFGAGVVTQSNLAITLADSNTTADVRVTATRSGGTETGQSNLFDVQPNDLHHFAVGTITSPRIANESFDLELTAQDIHDNTVTDFTGTVTISDTTGTVTPTTSAAFTGGVLTQSVEVSEADPDSTADVTVTVEDGGTGAAGTSNAFDVQAGSLDHFSLSIVPSTIVAGESFSVTITAQDADDNTVTTFTGTADLSDDTGTLHPTATDSFSAGVVTQSNLAITLADVDTTADVHVTVTRTGGIETGQGNLFDVQAAEIDNFLVGVVPSPVRAGESATITITARDEFDNPIANFDPTTQIDVTTDGTGETISYLDGGMGSVVFQNDLDGTASLPASDGNTFDANGCASLSIRNTTAEGPVTVTVSGGGATTSGLDTAMWSPGSLENFLVVRSAENATVNNPITISVTARDTFNNAIPNFDPMAQIDVTTNGTGGTITYADGDTDTVVWDDDGDGTASIDTEDAGAFNASGVASFTITNTTAETVTVTVTDTGDVGMAGSSTNTVSWTAEASASSFSVDITPSILDAGESTVVTVTALDQYNNEIPSYDPEVQVNVTTDGGAGTPRYADGSLGSVIWDDDGDGTASIDMGDVGTFDANGVATFTITNTTAGAETTVTVSADEANGSDTVDWDAGPLENFLVSRSAAIVGVNNPITMTVTARDAHNNAIPSFDPTAQIDVMTNGMSETISYADGDTGTVVWDDDEDGTASIDTEDVGTFDALGQATFTITNATAGTVTVAVTDTNGVGMAGSSTNTFTTINDGPLAVADTATVNEGGILNGTSVLANDEDAENDDLTAILVTDVTYGSLTLNPDGTYTYTHDGSETTLDSFTYKANDGGMDSNEATVTITVIAINDAPVAEAAGPYEVDEGSPLPLDGSESSDVDGTVVSWEWDCTDDGEFDVTADEATGSSCTYSDEGEGSATLRLRVTDDDGTPSETTAEVTIANVAPEIVSTPPGLGAQAVLYSYLPDVSDPGEDVFAFALGEGAPTSMEVDGLTGELSWTPSYEDSLNSPWSITLSVDDGDGGVDEQAWDIVVVATDGDEDGLADDWELAHGLSPENPDDATEDPDLDGLNNLEEQQRQQNPNFFDGPLAPTCLSPADGSEVATYTPYLLIANAVDPQADELTYDFEIYTDEELTLLVNSTIEVTEGPSGETRWDIIEVLDENQPYWWRARAADPWVSGDWSEVVWFFVSVLQEPPVTPVPMSPLSGDSVDTQQPLLQWMQVSDPDLDEVFYDVEVWDQVEASLVDSVSNEPGGDGVNASWTVSNPLSDNTEYRWRVSGVDEHGLAGEWSDFETFTVDSTNSAPGPLSLVEPADGAQVEGLSPVLVATETSDDEGDPLTYTFQVDLVATFDGTGLFQETIAETGTGEVRWDLDAADIELAEHQWHYARVRASDPQGAASPWDTITFFVRGANDAPPTPVLLRPNDGDEVHDVPTLVVATVEDPEGDEVFYEFVVATDTSLTDVLVSSDALTSEPDTEETAWLVSTVLEGEVYWSARAVDSRGAHSGWAPARSLQSYDMQLSLSGSGCGNCSFPVSTRYRWPSRGPLALCAVLLFAVVRRKRRHTL